MLARPAGWTSSFAGRADGQLVAEATSLAEHSAELGVIGPPVGPNTSSRLPTYRTTYSERRGRRPITSRFVSDADLGVAYVLSDNRNDVDVEAKVPGTFPFPAHWFVRRRRRPYGRRSSRSLRRRRRATSACCWATTAPIGTVVPGMCRPGTYPGGSVIQTSLARSPLALEHPPLRDRLAHFFHSAHGEDRRLQHLRGD